jgi:molybdate transport system substrate-binding protein
MSISRPCALVLCAALFAATGAPRCESEPEPLELVSGGAGEPVLRKLLPRFEDRARIEVEATFAVVGAIPELLRSGRATPDVIVVPVPLIDQLQGETCRCFQAADRGVIGRVAIGAVVRAGAAAPDISTVDKVRQALLDATSIAIPDPQQTPTGKFLMTAFDTMGITSMILPKLTLKNAIDGGIALVRDGRVQLGLYLVTEILPVTGVQLVGKLPAPALQGYVVYGWATSAASASPQKAAGLAEFLTAPENASRWTDAGFEAVP